MADKISAQMVKDLRDQTGAGMMECKKALQEAEGDMAKAELILVTRGLKKAQKSASRTAAEGVILVQSNATFSSMCEINCETDFVARDENFNGFCNLVISTILEQKISDVEALAQCQIAGESIEEKRQNLVAKIGENVQIRRINNIVINPGFVVGGYIHRGRIGVQAVLKGGDEALAKDLAMHIAAMNPQYIDSSEMPEERVAEQKAYLLEQEQSSGKPANVIEKIVEGKLGKVLNEFCLMGQPFFKEPDLTIAALLKKNGAEMVEFIRYEVGEGIEVKKANFADEVMAQARGNNA